MGLTTKVQHSSLDCVFICDFRYKLLTIFKFTNFVCTFDVALRHPVFLLSATTRFQARQKFGSWVLAKLMRMSVQGWRVA